MRSFFDVTAKSLSIGTIDGLPALPLELGMLPENRHLLPCPMAEDLIKKQRLARQHAIETCKGCESIEDMVEAMKSRKVVKSWDENLFAEECTLDQVLGEYGQARHLNALLG